MSSIAFASLKVVRNSLVVLGKLERSSSPRSRISREKKTHTRRGMLYGSATSSGDEKKGNGNGNGRDGEKKQGRVGGERKGVMEGKGEGKTVKGSRRGNGRGKERRREGKGRREGERRRGTEGEGHSSHHEILDLPLDLLPACSKFASSASNRVSIHSHSLKISYHHLLINFSKAHEVCIACTDAVQRHLC